MERKKRVPQTEITDSLLRFREKRKWQLALRRYVLLEGISAEYAFYFGLGSQELRNWIEIQFTDGLNWDNFGASWQFDHVVPVAYFNFSKEEDLQLCWNFVNIRVEKNSLNKALGSRVDVLAVKPYFEALYAKTGYSFCQKMLEKINLIEVSNIVSDPAIENFIIQNKERLELVSTLNKEEFGRLNIGMKLSDILLEREILAKFG